MILFPSTVQAAQVHRVAPRDNLSSIAQMYGITVEEVILQNGYLKKPGSIFPGQVLIIPKIVEENVYHVRHGDTLYRIAQKLSVTMAGIAKENQLVNWNVIYVGQALNIPSVQGSTQLKEPKPKPEPEFQHTVSEMLKMFPETFYRKGQGSGNQIALTFDDGPNTIYTPQILDILKQYDVPATFFVMGSRVERHPEVAQRIVAEGHVIGNHTWNHPDLRKVSVDELVDEMNQTEDAIVRTTGQRPALMRPPYGAINPNVLQGLKDIEYKVINWSVDSVDWRDQDVDQILINTLPGIEGNDIVLFHDAGGESQSRTATVEMLPELIKTLKMQGYEFVTVDQILNISPYK